MHSPVNQPIVTSHYGYRTLNGQRQWHPGIDYVSGVGDSSVFAILPGKCVLDFDGYDDKLRWTDIKHSAGNYICIQHFLPEGGWIFVRYLHLTKNTVAQGERIEEGRKLGDYADVGFSYGAHLHIECFDSSWQPSNIGIYLQKGGIPV